MSVVITAWNGASYFEKESLRGIEWGNSKRSIRKDRTFSMIGKTPLGKYSFHFVEQCSVSLVFHRRIWNTRVDDKRRHGASLTDDQVLNIIKNTFHWLVVKVVSRKAEQITVDTWYCEIHAGFYCIRLSGKCLSFANVFFTTVHLRTNVKPSLWNVTVFISREQNGSCVIRQNNIKQKMLRVYYFHIKRKKLSGQPNTWISL